MKDAGRSRDVTLPDNLSVVVHGADATRRAKNTSGVNHLVVAVDERRRTRGGISVADDQARVIDGGGFTGLDRSIQKAKLIFLSQRPVECSKCAAGVAGIADAP